MLITTCIFAENHLIFWPIKIRPVYYSLKSNELYRPKCPIPYANKHVQKLYRKVIKF